MNRGPFLWIILLASYLAPAQQIEFISEDLDFTLDHKSFSVNGDYCFRNPSNNELTRRIYYPVPGTFVVKPFDTIVVYDHANPAIPLRVSISDTLAYFNLTLPPFSEKCIRVFYRQHHQGKSARYILTTTSQWGKPIMRARFALTVRNNIRVNHFSISPDHESGFGEVRIYTWERLNFMPGEDMIFRFEVEPE